MEISPISVGYSNKIVLTPDSILESYRNDTLETTTRFMIRREKVSPQSDSIDIISYSNNNIFPDQRITLTGGDTLILEDRCMDCYIRTFVRIR